MTTRRRIIDHIHVHIHDEQKHDPKNGQFTSGGGGSGGGGSGGGGLSHKAAKKEGGTASHSKKEVQSMISGPGAWPTAQLETAHRQASGAVKEKLAVVLKKRKEQEQKADDPKKREREKAAEEAMRYR